MESFSLVVSVGAAVRLFALQSIVPIWPPPSSFTARHRTKRRWRASRLPFTVFTAGMTRAATPPLPLPSRKKRGGGKKKTPRTTKGQGADVFALGGGPPPDRTEEGR